jgi:hypothetical protein
VTNGTDHVLEALAVYRATKLLQDDDLPPLPAIRDKLMQRWGATPWSALIDCPWCLSVHLAAILLICSKIAPRLTRLTVRVLAYSAVTGLISETVSWLESSMETPASPRASGARSG